MIIDLYKVHFKKVNFKNKVYNFYHNLIKKELGTRNILTDDKNYKDLAIYFTRYDYGK